MSNISSQADNNEVEYFEAEAEAQTEDEEYEGVAAENLEEKLEEAEVSTASAATREIVVSAPATSASSDQSLLPESEKLCDNSPSALPTETENVTPLFQGEAKARLFWSETITLMLQLLPEDGDVAGRPVLLAVRHARTIPDYLMLRETDLGHLPLPLQSMLGRLKNRLATAPSPSSVQISQTTRSNTITVNNQDRTEPKANEAQSNNHSASSSTNLAQVSTATQEAQAQTNLSNGKEDKGRSKQLSLFD